MQNILLSFLYISYLFSIVVAYTCVPKDDSNAYFNTNEDAAVTDRSDWMSYLSDDIYLDQLSIPGAHDAGTYGMEYPNIDLGIMAGPFWQTVAWSFSKQLKAGVRWFDIRVTGPSLDIYHGSGTYRRVSGSYWEFFLADAADFLEDHPNEVIMVSLLFSDCYDDWIDVYENMNAQYEASRNLVFYTEDRIPRLGDVRGQIIIQRGTECNKFAGMIWPSGDNSEFQNRNFYVQGWYQVDNQDQKWDKINNCLTHAKSNNLYHKWHLNGIAWSQINGQILPEYPCSTCRDMNEKLSNAIDAMSSQQTSIGIISMDFPSDPLLGKIVALNDWKKAQCCFYQNTNYGGLEYCISSSVSVLAGLISGIDNNIESWKCSSGLYPVLYSDPNYATPLYTGSCGETVSAASTEVKNKASSIKIVKCNNYDTYKCDFYTDKEYSGTKFTVTNAARNQEVLTDEIHDKISSFYCYPGSRALLFKDTYFAGDFWYTENAERQSDLSTVVGWNDVISSIKVFAWHQCCFWVDNDYQNDYFCISETMLRVPAFFNDKISSWQCTGFTSAKLYKDYNLKGSNYTNGAGIDVAAANSILFNDAISSIEITINYPTNS